MINLDRVEDKQATVGTVTFFALLLLFLIIMGLMHGCTDLMAEEDAGGGVAVSIGNPDDGGPDNSSAEQIEDYTPPVEEEYVPESQVTSDVAEAPPVKKTEPTPPKTKKPTTKPVKQKKPKPKKPDPRSQFPGSKNGGTDKTGKGTGGDGRGGYKGNPDGTPNGSPDGNGGTGNLGNGTSTGPAIGPGIDGGIGGFKVAQYVKPESGIQKNGIVSLRVCVDKNGNVTSVSENPNFRDINMTNDPELVARASAALRKFKFTNVTNAEKGCGFINFTFKIN